MRFLITALLLGVVGPASAQMVANKISMKDNPDMYWNRGYGCSGSAESYNISLRVADVDVTAGKIDAIMTNAGAPSQLGSNNGYYGGNQPRGRQLNYLVPAKGADKLAKKLIDMGELLNYSMGRQNSADSLKQIEERIAVLEGELANEDALAKMPAAAYFLRSRLGPLKQGRETCLSGNNRVAISVGIQPKAAEGKP